MPPIECRLIVHSPLAEHRQQLETGFAMLERRGLVRLTQSFADPVPVPLDQHLRDSAGTHLRVVVNGRLRLHYDLHDAHEIHPLNIERCDFYFKRSFLRSYVEAMPAWPAKVLPLGLNYSVLPDFADSAAFERALRLGGGFAGKLAAALEALDAGNRLRFSGRLRHLEALPKPAMGPRVLFLVNAYDPHARRDRSPRKVEEYRAINEMRARCIRRLRAAFGSRFLGGFSHNAYTERAYPDLLVERHAVTRRRHYLRTLAGHPICVATTGLHGSTGWKFAEYVATARAIVSEPLTYEVPGPLAEGDHYLAFRDPDGCAEACARLVEDHDLRTRLMVANARYYRSHLRPDVLVLNTLLEAFCRAGSREPTPRVALQRQGISKARLGNFPMG